MLSELRAEDERSFGRWRLEGRETEMASSSSPSWTRRLDMIELAEALENERCIVGRGVRTQCAEERKCGDGWNKRRREKKQRSE